MKKLFAKYWLAVAVLLIVALLAANTASVLQSLEKAAFLQSRGRTVNIILDAGHGGEDGGAVTITGGAEKDLNLAITRKTEQVLAFLGAPCVLTRESDDIAYPPAAQTTRARKSADTKARVALINATPDAVLVSVHQNRFAGDPSVHGAQLFYAPTEGSAELADTMRGFLENTVSRVRPNKQIDSSIYIMNHVRCPAVLIECGFVSNREECSLLESDGYQVKLAAAIAAGLLAEGSHET